MDKVKVEWATHTQDWLTGCTEESSACPQCFAEMATAPMPDASARSQDGVIEEEQQCTRPPAYDRDALRRAFDELEAAREPQRVAINPTSDTFRPDAPLDSLCDLALRIKVCDQTWQRIDAECRHVDAAAGEIPNVGKPMRMRRSVIMLLTRHPDRMLAWQREHFAEGLPSWVWVGTIAEDQKRTDERAPMLLEVDAAVRFLLCKPLLGPIDLSPQFPDGSWWQYLDNLDGGFGGYGRGGRPGGGINWLITGGEIGPKARPSHPDWFGSLRDQCAGMHRSNGVPFFFTGWGEWVPRGCHKLANGLESWELPGADAHPRIRLSICGCNSSSDRSRHGVRGAYQTHHCDLSQDSWMQRVGRASAGRLLDGLTHDAVPEVSDVG